MGTLVNIPHTLILEIILKWAVGGTWHKKFIMTGEMFRLGNVSSQLYFKQNERKFVEGSLNVEPVLNVMQLLKDLQHFGISHLIFDTSCLKGERTCVTHVLSPLRQFIMGW